MRRASQRTRSKGGASEQLNRVSTHARMIVPGDHAMAFRQSGNVLPRVLNHLDAGELAP